LVADLIIPDIYIYLKVNIDNSLFRKNRENNRENTWSSKRFLERMTFFYDEFFRFMKKNTIVIEIDTNNISEKKVQKIVYSILKQYENKKISIL
jgi:thymidylate kinase